MNKKQTDRGFGVIDFEDYYKQICSLQESSIATDYLIWFGVDDTGPHLGNKEGARMHLTRKQAKKIIPILQFFVDKGTLPKRYKKI